MEDLLILSLNIVYLVGIASCKNDNVLFKVMNIESFARLEALTIKESLVSPSN